MNYYDQTCKTPHFSITRVSGSNASVLNIEEIKQHLKVLNPDEEFSLNSYSKASEQKVEKLSGITLLTTTLKLNLDYFPSAEILIPRKPIRSITKIEYYDSDNVLQEWDDENYIADLDSLVPRIFPVNGVSYPSTYCRPNAVQITFVAGYTSSEDVPEILKQAVRILTGAMYEYRESGDQYEKIEKGVMFLLSGEKTYA